MKRLFLLMVAAVFATSMVASAQVHSVDVDKLPKAAHEFIHKYFAQTSVSRVELDKSSEMGHYVVYFVNGDKATFDGASGRCISMDLATGSVPDALIPDKVRSYITSHYPSSKVISITHVDKGSRMMLSNGTELCFDRDGNVKRSDHSAKQSGACKISDNGK